MTLPRQQLDPTPTLSQQLRQALAELAMISHAPTPDYDFSPSEAASRSRWRTSDRKPPVAHAGSHYEHDGGTRTPRGVDGERRPRPPASGVPDENSSDKVREAWDAWEAELDDWRGCLQRRTPEWYAREWNRAQSDWRRERLLVQINEDLQAWHRSPDPAPGIEPPRDSFLWRCMIADSNEQVKETARLNDISARTVKRYRVKYRGVRGHFGRVDAA